MDLTPEIRSPLAPDASARLVDTVASSWIVAQYRRQYDVDVSEYFDGLPQIGVYECVQTGLRFYHPPAIAGREPFYRHLARFAWFYQQNKWEHFTALEHVQSDDRVLDIGCGTGNFLGMAKESRGARVTGIELNQEAGSEARKKGIEIVDQLVEAHAAQRPSFYDVVAAFQVLEHIAQPAGFIASCVALLKPCGRLIIGVPNNDGFLKYDPKAVLNGPPHHMGLWTRRSLAALTTLYPLQLSGVQNEPLQEIGWYQSVMEERYLPKRWMRSLFHRVGGAKIFRKYLLENAAAIAGHTILAIYTKRG